MGQKEHFWPKTTKFWPKTAKKSKTWIFAKNPKRHKSNFMQETRKKYRPVLAAEPERTDARTDALTDGRTGVNLKVPSGV